jgi:hypothetical protein
MLLERQLFQSMANIRREYSLPVVGWWERSDINQHAQQIGNK